MLNDLLIIALSFIASIILKKVFRNHWAFDLAIVAGVVAVCLGPEVLNVFEFSNYLPRYIDILLAGVFGTFPLTLQGRPKNTNELKKLWGFSLFQFTSQWALAILFVLFVVKNIYNFLPDSFSFMLPVGFAGGHGSAAVVGNLLLAKGEEYALTLTMTFATMGTILSLVGGIVWIAIAKHKGLIHPIDSTSERSSILRSLDYKTIFLFLLQVIISLLLAPIISTFLKIKAPVFVISVFIGVIFRFFFIKARFTPDIKSINSISHISTDLLVCVGIMSIKFYIVAQFLAPILVMSLAGFLWCSFNFLVLSPRVFGDDHFSKSIFTWGWSVGGLAFGLALVKFCMPKSKDELFEKFALTYLLIAPVEIGLLLTTPSFIDLPNYLILLAFFLLLLSVFLLKFLIKKPISN